MYSKMDWKPTDWIDAEDYNRIRQNFAAILNFNSAPPADVGYDYVPTAADVRALRAQYDAIAATLGVLAEFPSDPALYADTLDLSEWPQDDLYPPLLWLSDWENDIHFPAADELRLYESIVQHYYNRYGLPLCSYGDGTILGGGLFG